MSVKKLKSGVTVIIPVYNSERTLRRCIESILTQVYTNFEIRLINDGSTDRSPAICDELCEELNAKGYEIYVTHQINRGVSAARNIGISQAEREFFVCVDSDDIVSKDYLNDFMKLHREHPEFGHICCGFESRLYRNISFIYNHTEGYSIADRRDYMDLAEKIMVQSPCFRLYRTELVQTKNIRMREKLSLGEDLLFNLEYFDALENTTFGIINKANYIYCDECEGSLNHRYRTNLIEIYELIHQNTELYLKKWSAWDETNQRKFYSFVFRDYMLVLENTFHPKNPLSLREKLKVNRSIMKSDDFRNVILNAKGSVPKSLQMACSTGNYGVVCLVKKIRRIMKK